MAAGTLKEVGLFLHVCEARKGIINLVWVENSNMLAGLDCEESHLFVTEAAQLWW